MIEIILTKYNYWICILLMMTGLFAVIAKENLVKKIIGLNIFQTAVLLFFISLSKVEGGTTPILIKGATVYDNPLPQVLMLTAIVVGVSITAVALGIVMLINRAYGTVEEDQILEMNKHND